MIRLYPEQLRAQLNEGLRAAYLLLGNDPLLLQESQDAIRQVAAAQGFEEHHTFSIDPNTDWNAIFSLCQLPRCQSPDHTVFHLPALSFRCP